MRIVPYVLHVSLLTMALILSGCATREVRIPVETKIPVPVACEIEQVEQTALPVAPENGTIFDRAKVAAARIKLLMAENEKLRAANTNPCPAPKENN